jgi:hypothetical protein
MYKYDSEFISHLRPSYEQYLKNHTSEPFVFTDEIDLTYDEFLSKIKRDYGFAKMWGIDVELIPLTYEERYKIWFTNNYETGMEYNVDIEPDFENDYYEPTPTVLYKITYEDRTFVL